MKLTQKAFAALVAISHGHISKVELGEAQLTEPLALAIEYKTGIRKEWLFSGKGEMFLTTYDELVKKLALEKKAISDLEADLANLPDRYRKILSELVAALKRA